MTRRASFDALRRSSSRARSGPVSVTFAPVEDEVCVAFAIGRRFGPAVRRNRARRRLRAAFNEIVSDQGLAPGAYQIGAAPRVLDADYRNLIDNLGRCCRRLDVVGTSR